MELAGTFGWPDERTVFLLAGGYTIAPGMPGGVEDDAERGRAEMVLLEPKRSRCGDRGRGERLDPLHGRGHRSPRARPARSPSVSPAMPPPRSSTTVEVPVFLDTGPEVIAGSTRMGAGTAQKAALGHAVEPDDDPPRSCL